MLRVQLYFLSDEYYTVRKQSRQTGNEFLDLSIA